MPAVRQKLHLSPCSDSRGRLSYQLTKELQIYGVIKNLFNRKFATFGTYFDPGSIVNVLPNPPTDPRTITPAQPLSIYVGMRAKL